MALLQIAEPGQSAAPHQHKLAVGIDLGTTNTLVAAVRSGTPSTLNDEKGRALIPSVVHYGPEQAVVALMPKPNLKMTVPIPLLPSSVCLAAPCRIFNPATHTCRTNSLRPKTDCR